jgi:hypothetical protein
MVFVLRFPAANQRTNVQISASLSQQTLSRVFQLQQLNCSSGAFEVLAGHNIIDST